MFFHPAAGDDDDDDRGIGENLPPCQPNRTDAKCQTTENMQTDSSSTLIFYFFPILFSHFHFDCMLPTPALLFNGDRPTDSANRFPATTVSRTMERISKLSGIRVIA